MVELSNVVPWWIGEPAKLEELKHALQEHAPRLRLHVDQHTLVARGPFALTSDGETQDVYAIEIRFHPSDPEAEPKVWEIGGSIEQKEDNHISNSDDTCCLGVLDEWMAKTGDTSFAGFLTGPLWNFFLSQSIFRRTGKWIFDQRSHGLPGMVEAYAELIGDTEPTLERVARTLSFLSLRRPKGHWLCPCGSGRRVRSCCRPKLQGVKLSPDIAARLFNRLATQAVLAKAAAKKEDLYYAKQ
jgi:uncharacterized protein YciI